jgi:hypothetical protein
VSSKSFLFRIAAAGAVLCALSANALAEIKVGDKAPVIKAEKLANTKFKSLKEIKGSLVLYDYFAHW